MQILILGAKGQLGRALQAALDHHELTCWDIEELDICDRARVAEQIGDLQPELVINSAAYTDVDGCARDPELAYAINGLGPKNLALVCADNDIGLMQISSNEVFAGDRPDGYYEWDALQPVNPYGRSKAAGEFHVRALHRRHFIVRTAWLFAPGGRNFIHAILRRARSHGEVAVVTDEVGNPTSVADLAEAIGRLIETERYGTYHLVNSGSCSRWQFANEILRLAGLSHVRNRPILSSEFRRPSTPPPFTVLHNVAARALGITLQPWQSAVADYLEQIRQEETA